jgi:N-acetylmuramoyl-L-alanine amidase
LFEGKSSKKFFATAIVVVFLCSCIQIFNSNTLVNGSDIAVPPQNQEIKVEANGDGSYNITYVPDNLSGSDRLLALSSGLSSGLNGILKYNPGGTRHPYILGRYGSGTNLGIEVGSDLFNSFLGWMLPCNSHVLLLRFDLTGFPYSASNVTLKWDGYGPVGSSISIYNVTRTWKAEKQSGYSPDYDYLVSSAKSPKNLIATFPIDTGDDDGVERIPTDQTDETYDLVKQSYSWNITSLYNDWKSGKTMNNGVMFVRDGSEFSGDPYDYHIFKGSPELVITYTPKICIDPGHGGSQSGAIANGVQEKDINLGVAQYLKEIFLSAGPRAPSVIFTRENDITESLQARCDFANQRGATIFISIHHNAGGGHGSEVVFQPTYLSSKLADITYGKLESWLDLSSSKRDPIFFDTDTVLLRTKMPAIISEAAYLDSTRDFSFIVSSVHQNLEAEAIYESIIQYFEWYNSVEGLQAAHRSTMIAAHCPVDLEVTDLAGRVFSKTMNEIPDAIYDEGSDADTVYLPDADSYQIKVIPEEGALPTDNFTLEVTRNGVTTVLAENVAIADIPSTPYTYSPSVEDLISFAQSGAGENPTVTYSIDDGPLLSGTVPFSVSIDSGHQISYSYPSLISGAQGVQYVLTSTTPNSPQTVNSAFDVIGNYKTQYQVSISANPTNGGSTAPSGTEIWVDAGPLSISATANSGYQFSSWTSSTGSIDFANPLQASTMAMVNSPGTILANFVSTRNSIFENGFENNFAGWTNTWGSPSIVSSPVYSGSLAMQCSNPYNSHATIHISPQNTLVSQAEFQLDSSFTGSVALIGYFDAFGNPISDVGLSNRYGRLFVTVETYLPTHSYAQYEITDNLSLNAWFNVGMAVNSSSCDVYFNGQLVQSLIQSDMPPICEVAVGMFWAGAGAYQGALYVDNVEIWTPPGATNT